MKSALLTPLVALVALAATAVPGNPSASAAPAPASSRVWQVFSRAATMPSFLEPRGIAVDSQGDLYVADTGHVTDNAKQHVVKLSAEGRLLAMWGMRGSSPGRYRLPG